VGVGEGAFFDKKPEKNNIFPLRKEVKLRGITRGVFRF